MSASADLTVRLWDLETGDCTRILTGHRDTVWAVAIAKTDDRIVSTSFDNTIRVWDPATGECTQSIDWVRSCTSNISLAGDGNRLLLAGGDNRLWLIDLDGTSIIRSFIGHAGGVNAVRIAPNDGWAFSGGHRRQPAHVGSENRAVPADVHRAQLLHQFHRGLPGENARRDGFQRPDHPALARFPGVESAVISRFSHAARKMCWSFLPRSKVTCGLPKQKMADDDYQGAFQIAARVRANPEYQQNPRLLQVWDRIGRKGVRVDLAATWLTQSFMTHAARINSIVLNSSGTQALIGSDDRTAGIWSLASGKVIRLLEGHQDGVNSVALSPDDRFALSGSSDGTLRCWQVETGECLMVLSRAYQ